MVFVWGEIEARLGEVDDPDALRRARNDPALRMALDLFRPRNWHGSGVAPDTAIGLALDHGIPVAWTPPAELLVALARASQPADVLVSSRVRILDHCYQLLDECRDDDLDDDALVLARDALDAASAGFGRPAMALAVLVSESLADWALEPRCKAWSSRQERADFEAEVDKRVQQKLKKQPGADEDPVRLDVERREWRKKILEMLKVATANPAEHEIQRLALITPLNHFFTQWRPWQRQLTVLSRHVAVHLPSVDHYSEANQLRALMLVASILRDQQDWCDEVRTTMEV